MRESVLWKANAEKETAYPYKSLASQMKALNTLQQLMKYNIHKIGRVMVSDAVYIYPHSSTFFLHILCILIHLLTNTPA